MRIQRVFLGSTLLVAASVGVGRFSAIAEPIARGADEGGKPVLIGPDVVVGALPSIAKHGSVGGISAYSLGTTACNVGDEVIRWCDHDALPLCDRTQHPVIAQNLYRIADGRIEMIGMSWLKHGFCALTQSLCAPCQLSEHGCDALGVGCSDPYGAVTNGAQSNLGPRSQVNASKGTFPYPVVAPSAPYVIGRRIQVRTIDLDPAWNPGALYFGEGIYISQDDAAAGNSANNASHRRVVVGDFTTNAWALSLTGATIQRKAAIWAWKEHGLGLNVPDPDVNIEEFVIDDDGHWLVGHKASSNGDGTWRYEYAIFNLDSDRSGRAWSIPLPEGVTVYRVDQRIINHHSREPYSTAPWTIEVRDGAVTWSTETFAEDVNANALRWGTMFNFRFDADAPPAVTTGTLSLFKPGDAPDPAVAVIGPSSAFDPSSTTNVFPEDVDGVDEDGFRRE